MNLEALQKNVEARGFSFRYFDTAQQAADYLAESIHGKTVGIGGSMTLLDMGIYERLQENNDVAWHWKTPGQETLTKAAAAQVYLSSVNGIAETGEMINIDGTGNRVASTIAPREKVYLVAGQNKVAPTYDEALWRARNIAAPLNARRLSRKTPCAMKEELKCWDCKSPERICNGLTVLWRKLGQVQECELVLIGQDLGY